MILFLLSLIPVYLYLGSSLADNWFEWGLIFILFASILSFPFKKRFKYQNHLAFISMGFLTFLMVFTVLRDVISFLGGPSYPSYTILIPTIICLIVGFWNGNYGLRVKRVQVPVQDLPDSLEGFKIAQISDLHIGPTIKRPYVQKVVDMINSLNAHMITLTGDIGDGRVTEFQDDITPLSQMRSSYGSYFALGNHEYYWGANDWLNEMSKVGINNLVNSSKIIEHAGIKISISGIPDPVSRTKPDFENLKNSSDYKILLSHRPGVAQEASQYGFNLQLSGHTHGGQFFPWTIVVKFVHKLSQGLHQVGSMWLYINPGTGSWGPLLRLGTTSEVTLLTLTQAKK